ncbi:ExbD/TolR family protein [Phascolarctobacterium faecium]|uniref:ExbD/TolR family protein n=1 Tax=Phascolarctobacterium faecium TaxID=33025 RepID=UPI0035205D13
MRRRPRKQSLPPQLMLSPMIDMIFLLLVFFIVSTMYMSEIKNNPDQVAGGAEFRDRKQK